MSRSENGWVSEEENFSLAYVMVVFVEKGKATDIQDELFRISKGRGRVSRRLLISGYLTFLLSALAKPWREKEDSFRTLSSQSSSRNCKWRQVIIT